MGTRTGECFQGVKAIPQLISHLSSPLPEDVLFWYLAVSNVLVSAVLLGEENKNQRHVFYTSKMLLDVEKRYSTVEKMMLALVNAKKKLCHYFLDSSNNSNY